jgi:hypothetical protein
MSAAPTYSKYIAAAMATDETHGQIKRAHETQADAPPLFPVSPVQTDGLPSVNGSLSELRAGLAEKYYSEDLAARAGVAGTALWYAQTIANKERGITDSTDAALQRLDAVAERQARYRAAQGGVSRKPVPTRTRHYGFKINADYLDRVTALAALRGQNVTAAMNFVIQAGLTLIEERTKRYEAYVFAQFSRMATNANAERAALAVLSNEPVAEVERYLDAESATLRSAYQMVYPLMGAPPALAALASEYPVAS